MSGESCLAPSWGAAVLARGRAPEGLERSFSGWASSSSACSGSASRFRLEEDEEEEEGEEGGEEEERGEETSGKGRGC